MKKLILIAVSSSALLFANSAKAHIGYGGRDLGSWTNSGESWSVAEGHSGNFSDGSVTINVTNISSNFGWADATDSDWGDSHKGRWFKFTVNNAGTFRITVIGGGTNSGNGTYPYADGDESRFLPGFSIYKNLALAGTHDGAVLSIGIRRGLDHMTEGVLDAVGDFFIANDSNQIGQLEFVDYAVDGTADNFGGTIGLEGDGTADGTITQTFNLEPGTYSLFVGGATYAGQEEFNAEGYASVPGQEIVYGINSVDEPYEIPGSVAIPTFGASVTFAPIIPNISNSQSVALQSNKSKSSAKKSKSSAKKSKSSAKKSKSSAKKSKSSAKKSKSTLKKSTKEK